MLQLQCNIRAVECMMSYNCYTVCSRLQNSFTTFQLWDWATLQLFHPWSFVVWNACSDCQHLSHPLL